MRFISVTLDTSHSAIRPYGASEQSPFGDSLMHASTALWSSTLDRGKNAGGGVCACVCVCVFLCMCECVHVRFYACVRIYTVRMVCVCVCVLVCVRACERVFDYMRMCEYGRLGWQSSRAEFEACLMDRWQCEGSRFS